MRAKLQKIHSAVDPIPFPRQREILSELREMDERLRSLREKIENGDEAASIARTVALLYLDLIARARAFSAQLDRALDGQLFLVGHPFKENVRRAKSALRIYARISKMMLQATEGLLKCLGGEKVIALQAMARLLAEHPEAGTAISALDQQMQRIARNLAKK